MASRLLFAKPAHCSCSVVGGICRETDQFCDSVDCSVVFSMNQAIVTSSNSLVRFYTCIVFLELTTAKINCNALVLELYSIVVV